MLEKEVHGLILKYRLPLDRKSQSSVEFFKEYSESYLSDLKLLINKKLNNGKIFFTEKDFKNISSFKKQLLSILEHQEQSNTFEVVNEFEKFMKNIEDYLLSRPLSNSNGYQLEFYKIRPTECPLKKRKDLFVIPEFKRPSMQSQRFSIPGSPCLYLATDIKLAWYECNMPMSFSACQYQYKRDFDYKNKLYLDFAITPIQLTNNINFEDNIEFYKKYLYTFLLRAVCSIKFKTPNAIFKEEYVIPQLLMTWIKDNKNIAGIQYQSCSKYDQTRTLVAYNIAIPSKIIKNKDEKENNANIMNDELWKSFDLSEPEFYSINQFIKENLAQLNLINFEDLLSEIEIQIQNSGKPLNNTWFNTANTLLNIGKYYKVIYESVNDKTFKLNHENYYALQNSYDLVTLNNFKFCNDPKLQKFYKALSEVAEALRKNSITKHISKPSNPIFLDPFDPNEEKK